MLVCVCVHVSVCLLHTCVCGMLHTLLLLFPLECEVQCPDGEVDSLGMCLADVEQKVQDPLASH